MFRNYEQLLIIDKLLMSQLLKPILKQRIKQYANCSIFAASRVNDRT